MGLLDAIKSCTSGLTARNNNMLAAAQVVRQAEDSAVRGSGLNEKTIANLQRLAETKIGDQLKAKIADLVAQNAVPQKDQTAPLGKDTTDVANTADVIDSAANVPDLDLAGDVWINLRKEKIARGEMLNFGHSKVDGQLWKLNEKNQAVWADEGTEVSGEQLASMPDYQVKTFREFQNPALKALDSLEQSRGAALDKASAELAKGFVPLDNRTQTGFLPTAANQRLFPDAPAPFVSLDKLLYGGLVESRHKDWPMEKGLLPNEPTVSSEQAGEIGNRLKNEYLTRADAILDQMKGSPSVNLTVPRWDAHHRDVNRAVIDRVLDRIENESPPPIEFLSLGVDDAPVDGPATKDVEALKKRIEASPKLSEHVKLLYGVDELASCHLARNLVESGKSPEPKVFLASSGNLDAKGTLDGGVSVRENVQEHLDVIGKGAAIADDLEGSNLILYNIPPQQQLSPAVLDNIARDLKDLLKSGKPVGLADTRDHNGQGATQLLEALVNRGVDLQKLAGYSSWGTTGNALGSLLADSVIGMANSSTGAYLRDYHLVHDGVFLGKVADQVAPDRNIRYKGTELGEKENQITREVADEAKRLGLSNGIDSVQLPWGRTFEGVLKFSK